MNHDWMERTLILIKPDAVARHLIGRIITRFEEKGLILLGLKIMRLSTEMAERHYAEHLGKEFYERLIKFITSGPVVALAIEGRDAIQVCRLLSGATNAREAQPGTIRGDFGMSNAHNLIHASDSAESAARELDIFFDKQEFVEGQMVDLGAVYDLSLVTNKS
jgi:nucleoside-diphosphate kinase